MRHALLLLLLIFVIPGFSAENRYDLCRIYVLNHSDYNYTEFKKKIAFSKRYRGRYYRVFPFKKLKFAEYYLKENENLHTISSKLGISVDSIASSSGIDFFYAVKQGRKLIIPNFQGIIYKTRKGCSLRYLSRKYGSRIKDIQRFNNFYGTWLSAGRWLFIPGAIMSPLEQALFYGTAFSNPLRSSSISSPFGVRKDPKTGRMAFHGGIDMPAPYNTPVYSAHDGVVEFTGWAGGYGRLIVISHAFGFKTFYGHLRRINVKKGMKISMGKIIGRVGSSGYSTGPHLHFEIRRYRKKLDPKRYTTLKHRRSQRVVF